MNCIFIHSCEQMQELKDGSVDLTITSPPYWNAIDYDVHITDSGDDYRPRQELEYSEYLKFLQRCFREVLRVHQEGSFCAVVIGTVLFDGRHWPLPFHFISLMEQLGWQFHQDIVWYKCTGGVRRFSLTVQRPFPGYYYPNIMTEYILIFRKPGKRKMYARPETVKELHRLALDTVFTREIANNIWHIAPVPPGQIDHPCPFPEEIPYRLINLYSYQGDVVLDPFAGAGTTLKVAHHLGRNWVGYEIKEKYAQLSLIRIKEPLKLRKQLICQFDKIAYGVRLPPTRRSRRSRFRQKSRKVS